jgi:hypothetical protein
MAYTVRASRVIEASAVDAFERLVDHDSWARWMPSVFRPIGKGLGRLAPGAKFRVRIRGLLGATCHVTVVRSPSEITWCGGAKGVLWAEHRFVFEPRGEASVEAQSIETWHGFLARLLRFAIERDAKQVGEAQLEALASALRGSPGPSSS